MSIHIVKVQRSVRGKFQSILIYNEDRTICIEKNANAALLGLFNKNEYKVYYYAEFNNGQLNINNKITENEVNW